MIQNNKESKRASKFQNLFSLMETNFKKIFFLEHDGTGSNIVIKFTLHTKFVATFPRNTLIRGNSKAKKKCYARKNFTTNPNRRLL